MNLKLLSISTAAIMILILLGFLTGPSFTEDDKNSLAVMKFTTKAGGGTHYWHDASWDLGWGLAEMLSTALVETGKFKVLERQDVEDVLSEQDFGASGRIEPGTEAKMGHIMGAGFLVYGTVNEFEYSEKGGGGGIRIKGFKLGGKAAKAHVAMDVKVVDATTSEILFSKRFEENAFRKGFKVGYSGSDFGTNLGSFQKTPLGEATRAAIDKSAQAISERLGALPAAAQPAWSGSLFIGDDGSLVIKGGKDQGLSIGDILDVFKPKMVTVGGETLSVGEDKVGRIRLIQVGDKASIASPTEGSDFKNGYRVKVVKE